ncbi:MAG: restriction endonuclease subunit S [Gomphosphaeria aponina SAG 52.96 = DSM 107014]|uniref:Restriction endonuclease subunit S n=1 Tax=Gomphosphaeria aponina SAG 52.96 = DSM 107014 TaxID=1521640 RepID=A0A941JT32_9CHRO|nr:restriction endonuclease subunit S [Gomphosphaeria aponina SAG 52.96 = DSM 107014]
MKPERKDKVEGLNKGDLPQGWIQTKLIDVVTYQKGKKPKKLTDVYATNLVPYLDIEAFVNNNIRQYAYPESSKLAKASDVLIVWDGARSGLTGLAREGAIGSTIVCLTPIKIEQKYLSRFIQSKYQYINDNHRGSGIPHVDPDIFWNILIPLPPLNEQRRIVAKLEKMLAKVNDCKQRLERIPTILKRYRQSVLAAACSGRLTADWRELHPDVEPAEELLNKFRKRKDYKKIKIKDELPIPFDLPLSWQWINLIEVCESLTDGDHQPPPKQNEGIPFLVISNIKEGELDFSDTRYVPEEYYDQIKDSRKPRKGDILYSVVGSYGIPVLVNIEKKFCFQRHIALLRVNRLIFNKYLLYILQSRLVFAQATAVATGSAQLTVTLTGLRKLKIALPPLEEQQEIVRRVEALFKKCDLIEQRYQKAKAYIDKLTQSILAKAFRGELVPQDSNDEPAEVLLERIRVEKAQQEKQMKARKCDSFR